MDRKDKERGQSLIEIAIILPILLLLLLGVAEVGMGLRNYLVVVNANREGARYAAHGRFGDDVTVATVLNATVPMFTIVMAHYFLHDDRMTGRRALGLLVGFAGVAVLVRDDFAAAGVTQRLLMHPSLRRAEAVARRLGCNFAP